MAQDAPRNLVADTEARLAGKTRKRMQRAVNATALVGYEYREIAGRLLEAVY